MLRPWSVGLAFHRRPRPLYCRGAIGYIFFCVSPSFCGRCGCNATHVGAFQPQKLHIYWVSLRAELLLVALSNSTTTTKIIVPFSPLCVSPFYFFSYPAIAKKRPPKMHSIQHNNAYNIPMSSSPNVVVRITIPRRRLNFQILIIITWAHFMTRD